MREKTKQQALDEFYSYFHRTISSWTQYLFNGDQIQIGTYPYEKWLVITQTLNNTQPGDKDALVWDPKYIVFKDPGTNLFPIGITPYGAARLLCEMGILTGLAE